MDKKFGHEDVVATLGYLIGASGVSQIDGLCKIMEDVTLTTMTIRLLVTGINRVKADIENKIIVKTIFLQSGFRNSFQSINSNLANPTNITYAGGEYGTKCMVRLF